MININDVTLVSIDGTGKNTNKLKNVFDICSKELVFEKNIIITSDKNTINFNNIEVIKINPLTYKEYNKFCILDLNRYITTKHILLIQNDGFICNPSMWDNSFLEYDYIGPPWEHEVVPNPFPWTCNGTKNMVGCGGFSLRSKKLLEICSRYDSYFVENQILSGMNEDIFVCVYARPVLESSKCKFPELEIAKKFGKGSIPYKPGVTKTCFGFHNGGYIQETLDIFNLKHNTNYSVGDVL